MAGIDASGDVRELVPVDVLFPVPHGIGVEVDVSVQGVAQVARVPLGGCGILGSATALDKSLAKALLDQPASPWPRPP